MKKVEILALHLGFGGIENAITNLANNLVKKCDVTIISTYKLYNKPAFTLDKNIKVEYLLDNLKPNKNELLLSIKKVNIPDIVKQSLKALKVLILKKKLMIKRIKESSADVLISTRDIHNEWIGKYGNNKIIKIGWEHNHHNNNRKYINKIINSVKYLDYFVLVSNELNNFYKDKVIPKTIYIPNSIDISLSNKSKLNKKNIISVGRLSPEKGFSDLIKVFKKFDDRIPDWHLDIVGDGIEREKIEALINEFNLNNKITLHGFKDKNHIKELTNNSSIYAMTSLTESFGIVLIEAFSCGVPCVAFDSARGATEIIDNDINGYLIKNRDIDEMVEKLINLATNKDKRILMGNNAYIKSKDYDNSKINKKWMDIIE